MKRTHLQIVPLCALLCACGSEGVVELSLAQATFDELPTVDNYSLLLLDDSLEVVEAYEALGDQLPADLATLPAGSTHRMRVLGFAAGSSEPIKGGLSQSLTLRSGETQRVTMPFSSRNALVALPLEHAMRGTPDTNGALDEWVGAPSAVLDQRRLLAGPGGDDNDFWATLHFSWDATWLYLALEVHDNCPALVSGEKAGNCVEATEVDKLYFGLDGSGTGDFWIEVSAQGAIPRVGELAEDDIQLAMGRLPAGKGWIFEAAIRLSALGWTSPSPPPSNVRLGFGLLVVDADPGEAMVSTYGLSKIALGANSTTVAPENMLSLGIPALD